MTESTRILSRFEYHIEDLKCEYCLHYKRKSKKHINGCHKERCRFIDIRREAIANGRIKRERGALSYA
jgi:hypothetical protein